MYIPFSDGVSIDHFLPKSKEPSKAYEWDNFRLSLHKLNQNKGDAIDIIDPFLIQSGWFVLDFPSCLVRPGKDLAKDLELKIEKTIKILKLNDDDGLVQERCNIMVSYAKQELALPFMTGRYPFLAAEIVRQGIETTANQIFKSLP